MTPADSLQAIAHASARGVEMMGVSWDLIVEVGKLKAEMAAEQPAAR